MIRFAPPIVPAIMLLTVFMLPLHISAAPSDGAGSAVKSAVKQKATQTTGANIPAPGAGKNIGPAAAKPATPQSSGAQGVSGKTSGAAQKIIPSGPGQRANSQANPAAGNSAAPSKIVEKKVGSKVAPSGPATGMPTAPQPAPAQ